MRKVAFAFALASALLVSAPASASDTSDSGILAQSINDPSFQQRCRLRFIVAAIAVMTESVNVVSHTQRVAFAGALFNGSVDERMLAMVVLANPTNRTNAIANPQQAGGNILDNDIDFQVNSVFTGIATSRSW